MLDPSRRVTIEQIQRHRWMMAEAMEMPLINNVIHTPTTYEPNDQILRIMQNLGIDAQRTRESLKVNSCFLLLNIEANNIFCHLFNFYSQIVMIIIRPFICCSSND